MTEAQTKRAEQRRLAVGVLIQAVSDVARAPEAEAVEALAWFEEGGWLARHEVCVPRVLGLDLATFGEVGRALFRLRPALRRARKFGVERIMRMILADAKSGGEGGGDV